MPKSTVIHFPPRRGQTFADLCAPSREDDEKLLRVIAAYEAEGGQVLFPGESSEEGEAPTREDGGRNTAQSNCLVAASVPNSNSPAPFVSPFLELPLRTEDEARAQLNRPRIPRAKGLAQLIAEQTGLDRTFAKLFGG